MLRILFFEDHPLTPANRLFRLRLRRSLGHVEVHVTEASTVDGFERAVLKDSFEIIVLDIMARPPAGMTRSGTDDLVSAARTGVELLRRCRMGVYGERCSTLPVYIRTARGEFHIQQLCMREGASGYFQAGTQDTQLIQEIGEFARPAD